MALTDRESSLSRKGVSTAVSERNVEPASGSLDQLSAGTCWVQRSETTSVLGNQSGAHEIRQPSLLIEENGIKSLC